VVRSAWLPPPAMQRINTGDDVIERLADAASNVWEPVLIQAQEERDEYERKRDEHEGRLAVVSRDLDDITRRNDELEAQVRDLESRCADLQHELDALRRS
jgi:chromosome segregation ATPase